MSDIFTDLYNCADVNAYENILPELYCQIQLNDKTILSKKKLENEKTTSLIDAIEAMKTCIYDCPKMIVELCNEKDHIYCHRRTVYKTIRGMERNFKTGKTGTFKIYFQL